MSRKPYVREGAVKVSDHWLRSPLANINRACQPCHKEDEKELKDRVVATQDITAEPLKRSEDGLVDAIDAINRAKTAGASDADLNEARQLQRNASFYWDFASSANSTGFHSPQESARILATAIDYARQSQLAAVRVTATSIAQK